MKIGILQADDVNPVLQPEHGNYPQMFEKALRAVLPDCELPVYRVLDGELPATTTECDAWLITGSKFGVNDGLHWIEALSDFVRTLWAEQRPLVGICFGHQLMARALGGTVVKSDKGWGVGLSFNQVIERKPWMQPWQEELDLLVSHQDQVVVLPEEAQVLASSDFCPYYLIQYGECFLSVQGHPEFCVDYCRALMEMRRDTLPAARLRAGRASLNAEADSQLMMQWIASFLQMAAARLSA
ncbi:MULTISPECIES: glutamine amidotransferase-related protein [Halopseudomonas]|uniref:Gamma-glutamyl-gamma-aminobutyrate hydrolase family protein n=1 Tax=Halopseudomonas formosensis TaxID=1002526 RepID=A0ABU5BUQ2_9GAMM|nr:gamma-glutamyl-gamma-aminobutyrate hydrolase family protein [Halopseudomonas formosensis]MDX9686487.1 gamma-glutamyl-gamma-aminobutyrate hydrolase family protein [Halopseudomonas formosensis]